MNATAERAVELRRELCTRNLAFARTKRLTYVLSYGEMPVIVYAPEANRPECGGGSPAAATSAKKLGTLGIERRIKLRSGLHA